MVNQPGQRFARRSVVPNSKARRGPSANKTPKLRPIEQTLYILMSEKELWHLVDEFKGRTTDTSAMEQSLRRRGVTIRRWPAAMDPTIVQVWAKWEHPVPTDVAPWMVRISSRATK